MALATRGDVSLAIGVVLVSAAFFLAAAPLAKTPLPPQPPFVAIYASALATCDVITAILLFAQFSVLRSRAVLMLASGYLLTSALAILQLLTFPGVFTPAGLFDVGPQFAAWIYILWHAAFPLVVLGYAVRGPTVATTGIKPGRAPWMAVSLCVLAILAAVSALPIVLSTAQVALPAVLQDGRITDLGRFAISLCWLLSVLAAVLLWRRKQRTVLDVWLMVVMCAWIFDLALASILNTGRYDLGWYAGRVYGLLAASLVLGVLLVQSSLQFARLYRFSTALTAANRELEELSAHDGLTGLANRRRFDTYLAQQVASARRTRQPLGLVIVDVDAFKRYNDSHGHLSGDECLKQIAAALRASCRRPADLAARFGGEEFALILPDTDLAGALRVAEGLRDSIAGLRLPHRDSPAASYVTVSGGAAALASGDLSESRLLAAADQALYEAKRRGRNRIC
jgi:diguanylate cyclase (GGDEF)-like protein